MKSTLLQICIKAMFPQLLLYPLHCFHVRLFWILSIDQNVIQVHYNEDIKLFSEDLVNVALKTGGCVGKAKKHYLILEVVVSGAKGRLLFVTFSNPHLVIGTRQIQLGKPLGLA